MKQLKNKKTIVILISVCLVIIGIIGAILLLKTNKSESKDETKNGIEAVSSGIDGDKEVDDVKDVEEVIEKWIEKNPKFIVEKIIQMQKKEMEQQQKNSQVKLSERKKEIFKDKNSPVFGDGNVTVVEFFDYACGYCKKAHEVVEQLIGQDKKITIIFKEFPILSKDSEELSKIALAVNAIDSKSYKKVHDKFMTSQVRNKEEAISAAVEVGVNEDKLKKYLDSNDKELTKIIEENRKLATELGIGGTPAFVIGDELIPGYLDIEALKEKVKQNRK